MLGKEYEKVQVKTDRDGLSARISRKGRIALQYRYRWNGQGERVDIGTYPATSLKEARDEALRMRGELEQNHNPRIIKRLARHEAYSALSVEDVIRLWLKKYGVEGKSDDQQVLRSFELHLFPQIGCVPHDNAPVSMWLNVLEPLAVKLPCITVRLLSNAKQAHNWAMRRQLIKTTPLSELLI